MSKNNAIFSFVTTNNGTQTVVTIQSPHGLVDGDTVEVLHSDHYIGTYEISSVATASFIINAPFIDNEQGCAWQVSRSRPVLVNPTGETIDTLRQAFNQISNDVGNKEDLINTLEDRRDLVRAINSLLIKLEEEERLKNLILAIATN